MKEYKENLLQELTASAEGERIISVRDKATAIGIRHMKTQEVLEVCNRFLQSNPGYKLVKMVDSERDNPSLFCSATLIEKTVEFED